MIQVFQLKYDGHAMITMDQRADRLVDVSYGAQVICGLDYTEACKVLGQCIMHDLHCQGKFEHGDVP